MSVAPDPARLARKRAAARAALWFERLWPAVWPALGVLGAYACAGLLDLPAYLPPWPRAGLLVSVVVGAAALLALGLRRVRPPSPAEADRRLEQATGLRHRPLAALADRPAEPTPEAMALWQVHMSRLAAQIPRLRVGVPRPGLARRDGWALRGLLLVLGAACMVIAGPDALPRLRRAVLPSLPAGPAAPGTQVQAWITPPAYTGLPPVFLHPGSADLNVPVGSHLTVSVTGGRGEPGVAVNQAALPTRALDNESWQAERELGRELGDLAVLSVSRGGAAVASWTLALIPDAPPSVGFTEPPGRALSAGRPTLQTRLSWHAEDDYGIASVGGELRLRDRPGAAPLVLSAPLAGRAKSARGAITQDLTAHPWAGLAVTARMVAKDAAGQAGQSADAPFVLPERPFQNPVAQALIAIRRQLSLTPDDRRPAATALDAIADMPEAFDNASSVLLNLRSLATLLLRGREPDTVEEAQARLWALALALEENGAERTARALEQARQAMREAMDRAAQSNDPADRAELDRRMQELREAIQKHMEALAEQARREGAEPLDPNAPQLNARDLDRMAQRMQDAAREGRMDDAKQQMAELEQLLQELQNARPEHGEQREKQNAERRQRGRQQQDAVQDMVRREGGLLDRSQNRNGQPPAPPPGAQAGPQPGQQPGQQRDADGRAQRAMRRALGELMQRFGDLTGQVPAPLGEADAAMREAGQALAEGRDSAAGAAQQRAIEALQKGGREMGQQMARQFGTGQPQGDDGQDAQDGQDGPDGPMGDGTGATDNRDGQPGGPQPGDPSHSSRRRRSADRDPLGRPLDQGTSGRAESDATRVPDTMEEARTRAIQDELRRRGADKTRPQDELDYIDRLLKPF